MKTIIHDLQDNEIIKIPFNKNDRLIDSKKCKNGCIGCFSCWTKHPTKCIYNDEYSNISQSISQSNELIIISKNCYGCYNDNVKKVLERCIGYVEPYFTIREGMIHHKSRFKEKINFTVYIYGDITNKEKESLNDLVKANSINLNAKLYSVYYIKNIKELSHVYIN